MEWITDEIVKRCKSAGRGATPLHPFQAPAANYFLAFFLPGFLAMRSPFCAPVLGTYGTEATDGVLTREHP